MLIFSLWGSGGGPERDPFEVLFRRCYPKVQRFFVLRGCSAEDSRDLAQETFLRGYRGYDGFRGDAQATTWLLTIATNLWRNRLRDADAAKRSGDEVPLAAVEHGLAHDGDRPLERTLDDERRRLLLAAIEELPPGMRRCVMLRVYQDKSFRDIAVLVGVSEATAKSQVSRARKRLRVSLAHHFPDLDAMLDDGP